MKKQEFFWLRQSAGVPASLAGGFGSMSIFAGLHPLVYFGVAAAFYAVGVFATALWQRRYIRREYRIEPSEFNYIQDQLAEANRKIKQSSRFIWRVRSLGAFQQLRQMQKLSRRIVKVVNEHPRRFYSAQSFFYSHLESAVELTDKYTLLAAQPVKDADMQQAIRETGSTLRELNDTLAEDLAASLSSDMDHLHSELAYAQHTLQTEAKLLSSGREAQNIQEDDQKEETP